MHGDDSRVYRTMTQRDKDEFLNDQAVMQTEDEEIDQSQRMRSKEIKSLVSTINDLAVLFKELSVLVVE